jgi:hypothetical protein
MAAVARGTKPPDAQVVTSLRLPPELMIGLKLLAVRKRKAVNDVIVGATKKHLDLCTGVLTGCIRDFRGPVG